MRTAATLKAHRGYGDGSYGLLPRYAGHPLAYLFTCAFLLVLAYLVPAAFLWNNCDLVAYSVPLTLLCFAAAGGAAYGLYRLFLLLCGTRFLQRRTLWVALFFAALLLLQAVLAHSVYYQPGWDVSILTEGGYWLAHDKGMVDPAYFRQYPNNVPLLMVWAYVSKLLFALGGTDFLFAEIMLCTVAINAAVFFVYLLADRFCGAPVALTAAALCVPFLCLAPWIVIPYSDTATLLFPVLAFWLWCRADDAPGLRARILWYLGAGLVVGIGYSLKPTVFIVCIAFALADLLGARPAHTGSGGAAAAAPLRERLFCLGAMLAVVFVLMAGSSFLCRRVLYASGVTEADLDRYAFPATHFFNMGLSESISPVSGGTVYGKWYGDDVLLAGDAPTHADKVQATLHAAGEKLRAMGPLGYLSYLNRKVR
ncbi:MAG: glycosyltransferase family 39 protein, partial [Ruthenibacterium sp.]